MSRTPPMGWNSWNTFGDNIDETVVRETADAFVDNGLSDAGYQYVVIDDRWSKHDRNKQTGQMEADETKFPQGMKALSDYVHGKGLKFGMYSCAGVRTCADYPGSFEYEFLDAETFASWGVDFLKYDFCYKPGLVNGPLLYKRMAMALRASGRDILFSACSWGSDQVETFIRSAGAHMWRSTGDIQDSFESVKNLFHMQMRLNAYGAPGCYNDMDMLIVGMRNKGNVALGGCTDDEYKTHFSIWCMQNSPLMIGCDVRNMDKATKEILTNKEIIAINQDEEGRQPYLVSNMDAEDNTASRTVWIKPLSGGDYAIAFYNLSDNDCGIFLPLWDIGLPTSSGYGLRLRDVWKHEDIGVFKERIHPCVPAHGCVVYRAKIVKD